MRRLLILLALSPLAAAQDDLSRVAAELRGDFKEFADDNNDPATALSETRRLVTQEGVNAIVPDVSLATPADFREAVVGFFAGLAGTAPVPEAMVPSLMANTRSAVLHSSSNAAASLLTCSLS